MKLIELNEKTTKEGRTYTLNMADFLKNELNKEWKDELQRRVVNAVKDTLTGYSNNEELLPNEIRALQIDVGKGGDKISIAASSREYLDEIISEYNEEQLNEVQKIHDLMIKNITKLLDKYMADIKNVGFESSVK